MATRSLLEDVLLLFYTAQEEMGIEMDHQKAAEFIAMIHNSHLTSPLPSLKTVKILLALKLEEGRTANG
jgi:hypothetical protein